MLVNARDIEGRTALITGASRGLGLANVSTLVWVMLAVAFACLPIFLTGREIARWEGGVFLAYYTAYVVYLILDAQGHDALDLYSNTMLSFVVPITVVSTAVSAVRISSRSAGGPSVATPAAAIPRVGSPDEHGSHDVRPVLRRAGGGSR